MSLTSALSIARSGLTMSSRAADLISQNVANALTEGYGRRELELSASSTGGVSIAGVTRFAERAITADRRVAEAAQAGAGVTAAFHSTVEDAVGTPGSGTSLSDMVGELESALVTAASTPQSDAALQSVVDRAQDLASRVGQMGDTIYAARRQADASVGTSITSINEALRGVEALNAQIASLHGADASGLLDQRQSLIDGIAGLVPLREVEGQDGRVSLYTASGTALLDGRAGELARGTGGGLTLNGRDLPTSAIEGGALAAQISVRDDLGVAAQADIDAFAADLQSRLPGLFEGPPLKVQASVAASPQQVRDGAGGGGTSGDASRIVGMLNALTAGAGAGGAADALASSAASSRVVAEDRQAYATARYDTLHSAELEGGVDTDVEMQDLLLVQQIYSANAKVIQAIDGMLGQLMEL
ncbi:flagellar hook-associated protein FlgK [Falsirhodobacter algicola]|uniref:Flagellar hook-associated protein 1 n=1 Tax=Falsirhodobacter algicola TaxID=2692330 RepID=A0A8J8MTF9_9RHOB|nr:flagellar hook-associated protein FlgK [Falsirhodobacter algicola]QUS36008.1 flagellar hook-associated protein FlgK [Falsirhodobacter algicola]